MCNENVAVTFTLKVTPVDGAIWPNCKKKMYLLESYLVAPRPWASRIIPSEVLGAWARKSSLIKVVKHLVFGIKLLDHDLGKKLSLGKIVPLFHVRINRNDPPEFLAEIIL